MAAFDLDSSTHSPVNNYVYQSVAAMITKLSDCNRSAFPNSDSYGKK